MGRTVSALIITYNSLFLSTHRTIIGNNFNFTAAESAQINTLSGDLHLNPADGSAGTLAVGTNQQTIIQQEIDSFFTVKANK